MNINKINEYIIAYNLFMHELASNLKNVKFLQLILCSDKCYFASGIHLSYREKQLLCNKFHRSLYPEKCMELNNIEQNHNHTNITEIYMNDEIQKVTHDWALSR